MAINGYPFDCETDAVSMLNNWNKAYYEKALSEAFAEAKQIDILPVLKKLLAIDP